MSTLQPITLKRLASRRRGAALATSLVLIFAMSTLALGLVSLVGATIQMSQHRNDTTEAFNMADSGVDLAIAWLTQQASPPDDNALHPMTNFYGTNGTITAPFGQTGTTLTVRIDGDATNPTSTQKHYVIESQATMPSGASQTVRVYVQQASFGKYAYFTVNDGAGFWDFNNHFEGPFHSNDADGLQTTILWKSNNTANPMFTYTGDDAFSVSGNVTWWKNSIGVVSSPSSISDYKSIATSGQPSMTTGYKTDANGNFLLDSSGKKIPNSAQIPLPTTDYTQEYAAMGLPAPTPCTTAPAGTPTTAGATIVNSSGTVSGGIFLHGNSVVALSVNGSGNQVITVTQGTTIQTITVDPSNNQTKVDKSVSGVHTMTTLTGTPNGMVYSDGNITGLSGQIADNKVDSSGNITYRSQMTIATDIAASKDVTLTGSITYNTARNLSIAQASDTNFNQKAGVFGLLGHHISVASGAGPNLEYDGNIFATSTFDAANPSIPSSSSNGTMTSIGGVITQSSGIFAYANSDGSLASGYQEQYHYDTRLADHPPPFFPTTGNHYDVLSWQRVTGMLT
ncbi:hypothetical protein CCAX7_43830 [Capsulimonas corticalis]|uniref:Uncharacterized protein n=1 Tax=Capsulimonas corticalis TaxID=2219043 RepID=A0A402CXF8_9BACT|nr:hypothetical protein [Capsulimonas corticalis]BDI32332.1 hypothetical protein CCAX7_43830 [Capsulimonas corticalis]